MASDRLAFVIAYGPEARAFLQSGLAVRLGLDREVAVVTPRPGSAAFQDAGVPVLAAPSAAEGAALQRARARSRAFQRRIPPLSPLARAAERCAGRLLDGGKWTAFLREHGIGQVVAASASGARVLPALQAAANLGLSSVVLLNSWRDPSVRPDFPVRVSALGLVTGSDGWEAGVGSPRLARVVGSLHQAAVRRAPAMDRRAFCTALGLDPHRPIVLYAASANDDEEPDRVWSLAERLQSSPFQPQLLVRTNPMDDFDGAYATVAVRPGVALMRPVWEWVRAEEWNCPLPADLPCWRGALEHAAVAVSLPSTVALDFAAWGKPTVNLAWGRSAALWSAGGYAAVRRAAPVVAAESLADAVARIEALLHAAPRQTPVADPVEAAARLIGDALSSAPRAFGLPWPASEVTP